MTFKTPDTFYLVAVDFSGIGLGSGGDITPEWDDAVDQYAEQVDYEPVRVFRIDMDADNMPAAIADVTADADETLDERMGRS